MNSAAMNEACNAEDILPLCAVLVLRMTRQQILDTLFNEENVACLPKKKPDDKTTYEECSNDSSLSEFLRLPWSEISLADVLRLIRHIEECDTCKRTFARRLEEAKPRCGQSWLGVCL
jgi:hypothetical protein